MKDLEWYKRQEIMDAIQYNFGLDKTWQEKFLSDMKLLIPKSINNHYIVSDIWFDIVNLDIPFPEIKVFVKCSDMILTIYEPFSETFCAGFDMLKYMKDYDDERKNGYLNCITESVKKEITNIVMMLIEFLNKNDKENNDGSIDRCICSF